MSDVTTQPKQPVFASVSGSPLWGLSVQDVIAGFRSRGLEILDVSRPDTPFGAGPITVRMLTSSGREVVWIPSYGIIEGEEFFERRQMQRLFWILASAGVEVLVVGGTCGTNDWRDPLAEDSVRPGDIVLPWSYWRGSNLLPATLPDTECAMGVLPNLPVLKDVFCTELQDHLRDRLRAPGRATPFRKVHTAQDVQASIVPMSSGTFETPFENAFWRTSTRLMSSESSLPQVTIFGDCVSPALARQLGIHLVYYHVPSNWVEGHPAAHRGDLDVLDDFYLNVLPEACLDLEVEFFDTAPAPVSCACAELLVKRPEVYVSALTPREQASWETSWANAGGGR